MADELPDPDSAPYWEGIASGELRYQRCGACDAAIFYPRSICPACGTPDPEWQVSAGNGVVHACSVIHRAPPAHKDDVPYVVALVDLAEGFRMMSRIVDCDPAVVAVGQAVRVVYRADSDGQPAPYFAPAE
jgi:uncharacterized OB-fold protein